MVRILRVRSAQFHYITLAPVLPTPFICLPTFICSLHSSVSQPSASHSTRLSPNPQLLTPLICLPTLSFSLHSSVSQPSTAHSTHLYTNPLLSIPALSYSSMLSASSETQPYTVSAKSGFILLCLT
ncbi:hypothetical protein Pmani_025700 [Petrolisthes manimaculis]|uniref:Uncharacterized protein n=1 Tax=Petrolisthes manimaculis TaxID=1843537 RepID=A0AAE1P5N2_9EUCA|nr:hypothetical protein Pmani_025700 [Petrolisthes manimaculis]